MEVTDPTSYDAWDDLIGSMEEPSFFYTSSWANTLSHAYGYEPCYFLWSENRKVKALVPFMEIKSPITGIRGVCLPFTDYCEPYIGDGIDFGNVFSSIAEFGKKRRWKYMEIRGGETHFGKERPYSTFFGHVLYLSGDEKRLLKDLKDTTRRNIKKAQGEGLQIEILTTEKAVQEFYRLNAMTRKLHGLPPQPPFFFRELYEHVISKGMGVVVLAFYQNKAIAGALYLHYGDKVIYKYGASDRAYQHLRPNNLVMWEAIKWYNGRGYRFFYFGRTETENQGLRRFKLDWGTEEYTIRYYRYDLKKGCFMEKSGDGMKLANTLFRRMPLPLLKTLGRILYRHVG
ncbi:MAG: GNAT family N-acetyltransferase [Syntrophorhabdaceae bacterium]|nr:GNAT family N-acetyltransferase [Syntrophorhabdaceae bacterium]